jgi:integrase
MRKRSFGAITRLPSKRYRARYTGPDTRWHNAPTTYSAKLDAEAWLVQERRLIDNGSWTAPSQRRAEADKLAAERRANTFGRYADAWITGHSDLADSTLRSYRTSVDRHLKPAFGELPLTEVTPSLVRAWYNSYGQAVPTARAHAYQVLSGIFRQAEDDEVIVRSPCRIRGASASRSTREPQVLSLAELLALAEAMPQQHRAMTLICGLCGLRFGEAAGLRRQDLDLDQHLLHVRRGVVRTEGRKQLSRPKTAAALRTVAIPAFAVEELEAHLRTMPRGNRTSLIFPGADGEPLASSSLYGRKARTENRRNGHSYLKTAYGFYAAREAIGRPDLHWHDLRRTAATLGAQSGATVREMQHRLGHTTPAMALHYQAATIDRDRLISERLQEAIEKHTTSLQAAQPRS